MLRTKKRLAWPTMVLAVSARCAFFSNGTKADAVLCGASAADARFAPECRTPRPANFPAVSNVPV